LCRRRSGNGKRAEDGENEKNESAKPRHRLSLLKMPEDNTLAGSW
jgi:hypothetical protein